MAEQTGWSVVLTPAAERDLRRLQQQQRERILDGLEHGTDLRKLQGRENEWRLRIGDWRARVRADFSSRVLVVFRILPRGRAYRD